MNFATCFVGSGNFTVRMFGFKSFGNGFSREFFTYSTRRKDMPNAFARHLFNIGTHQDQNGTRSSSSCCVHHVLLCATTIDLVRQMKRDLTDTYAYINIGVSDM